MSRKVMHYASLALLALTSGSDAPAARGIHGSVFEPQAGYVTSYIA